MVDSDIRPSSVKDYYLPIRPFLFAASFLLKIDECSTFGALERVLAVQRHNPSRIINNEIRAHVQALTITLGQ